MEQSPHQQTEWHSDRTGDTHTHGSGECGEERGAAAGSSKPDPATCLTKQFITGATLPSSEMLESVQAVVDKLRLQGTPLADKDAVAAAVREAAAAEFEKTFESRLKAEVRSIP